MGLAGSGKSTLIRHINRLVDPTAGEVRVQVDGREVDVVRMGGAELRRFRRECTAMVFQTFALFLHLTVLQNAGYGLQVRGLRRAERVSRARRWISRVGLDGYENRCPRQLSGGAAMPPTSSTPATATSVSSR